MKALLFTMASDQHVGFSFATRYVNRCLLDSEISARWLIVDDGAEPVPIPLDELRCDVDYVRREPENITGMDSLRRNLRTGLDRMLTYGCDPETVVFFVEDDWLAGDWMTDALKAFSENENLLLFGETGTRYYNVASRRHHTFRPNGRSALACTAMRMHPGIIRWIIDYALPERTIMMDDRLWRKGPIRDCDKILRPESRYCVGIKGLPGKAGLGMGHRFDERHPQDADLTLLKEWVGVSDASLYETFYQES